MAEPQPTAIEQAADAEAHARDKQLDKQLPQEDAQPGDQSVPTSQEEEDRFVEQAGITIPSKVMMMSGCRDFETSAGLSDVRGLRKSKSGTPGGAFTSCMLGHIEEQTAAGKPELLWTEIIEGVRNKLELNELGQIPQLSASRRLDMATEKFEVINPAAGPSSTKRALIVGINYTGQNEASGDLELFGCIADALEMKKYLEKHGIEEFRLLLDEGGDDIPTLDNIRAGLRWLGSNLSENASCFLFYSGHGTSTLDQNHDEADHMDECLVPLDFIEHGLTLTDDEILRELVLPLPGDAVLNCIFDCCNSGTILDLPFQAVVTNEDAEVKWKLVINTGFKFSRFVELGKELLSDAAATVLDSLTGGLRNLANFVQGFKNIIPI